MADRPPTLAAGQRLHAEPPMIKVTVQDYGPHRSLVLLWRDPTTERRRTKSAGTRRHREAERAAAKLEAELNSHGPGDDGSIDWEEFRARFYAEKLAAMSPGSKNTYTSALNSLDNFAGPARLRSVTASVLSQYAVTIPNETTRKTYLRHIHGALSWAKSVGLITSLPVFPTVKTEQRKSLMRSRPITEAEHELMLAAVPNVRPDAIEQWRRYLRGLWLSGLRLSESVRLSWDASAAFSVDLNGNHPMYRIHASGQKSRRDELLPIVPDFAAMLAETPAAERSGRVFDLPGCRGPLKANEVGKLVSDIGAAAGVMTAENKSATAHDYRRAFATRWSRIVMPDTLKALMRHRSLSTTMAYYIESDADKIAADVAAAYNRFTTSGDTSTSKERETQ